MDQILSLLAIAFGSFMLGRISNELQCHLALHKEIRRLKLKAMEMEQLLDDMEAYERTKLQRQTQELYELEKGQVDSFETKH